MNNEESQPQQDATIRDANRVLRLYLLHTHGTEWNMPSEYWDAAVYMTKRALIAEATLTQAREAIEWALGERGEFPKRQGDAGTFWWRKELRTRARAALATAQPAPETK